MTCARCVFKNDQLRATYASVLMELFNLDQNWHALEEWAENNFVPSLTHYCSVCHKITFLIQHDYVKDKCVQLTVLHRLHQLHTIPLGHAIHESNEYMLASLKT